VPFGQIENGLVFGRLANTGTPPLTRFLGNQKNRVKGKPHYRRTIIEIKLENETFELPKSTF
jgi:hypothetical protein